MNRHLAAHHAAGPPGLLATLTLAATFGPGAQTAIGRNTADLRIADPPGRRGTVLTPAANTTLANDYGFDEEGQANDQHPELLRLGHSTLEQRSVRLGQLRRRGAACLRLDG